MRRPQLSEIAVAAFLVVVGVTVRVAFQHIPNFAPVAALALFAGYLLPSRVLALTVPMAIMAISDRIVEAGGYAWPLMLTVYGLVAAPILCSGWLKRNFDLRNAKPGRSLSNIVALMGCSLVGSVVFFVGTNCMVWMTSSWYEPNLAGLVHCLTQGIPFFRFTLAGDAFFAALFFGTYAVACHMARRTQLATDLRP